MGAVRAPKTITLYRLSTSLSTRTTKYGSRTLSLIPTLLCRTQLSLSFKTSKIRSIWGPTSCVTHLAACPFLCWQSRTKLNRIWAIRNRSPSRQRYSPTWGNHSNRSTKTAAKSWNSGRKKGSQKLRCNFANNLKKSSSSGSTITNRHCPRTNFSAVILGLNCYSTVRITARSDVSSWLPECTLVNPRLLTCWRAHFKCYSQTPH